MALPPQKAKKRPLRIPNQPPKAPRKPFKKRLLPIASSRMQGPMKSKAVSGTRMSAQERRMLERMFKNESTSRRFDSSRANNRAENKRNSRRA